MTVASGGPARDPRSEYQTRRQSWRDRAAALDRQHLAVSNARLVVAALVAVLLWLAFMRERLSAVWPGLGVVLFIALVVVHARILQRAERARRAAAWYDRGLDRLDGHWVGRGRDGARFIGDHLYARDLDLFGRGSLFELLNTARTESGEESLAARLVGGATVADVAERQAAVGELRDNVDFREELAVLAAETEVSRTSSMAKWGSSAPAGLTRAAAVIFSICSAATVVIASLVFTDRLDVQFLLLWFGVEAAVMMAWRHAVRRVLVQVASADRDLALLSGLLVRIEREAFTAPRLAALQAALLTGGVAPSRRIAQLRQLVSWIDSTRNQLFAPFALALLLPQLLAVAVDRWHTAFGPRILDWLNVVGELEALAALGTYAFEHPADPFPVLQARGPIFQARGLGHPLMAEAAAVRNDLQLGGDAPHVIVISGSNMSGKSTLLRSVGVNVVLALAGAPVRAAALTLSPLAIGATLKVEDSLQEGHSRFYAEILRIKSIVDLARGSASTLFLLDEILHGTNSYDRRIGAEAIVRALVALGAIGLVTTHDLALTELPAKLERAAANMHFEDRLEDGKMVFDYRMRPGVVEHSNALALMRAIGLEV